MKEPEPQTPEVVKAMIALDQNIYLGTVSEKKKVKARTKNKMAKKSRKANRGS